VPFGQSQRLAGLIHCLCILVRAFPMVRVLVLQHDLVGRILNLLSNARRNVYGVGYKGGFPMFISPSLLLLNVMSFSVSGILEADSSNKEGARKREEEEMEFNTYWEGGCEGEMPKFLKGEGGEEVEEVEEGGEGGEEGCDFVEKMGKENEKEKEKEKVKEKGKKEKSNELVRCKKEAKYMSEKLKSTTKKIFSVLRKEKDKKDKEKEKKLEKEKEKEKEKQKEEEDAAKEEEENEKDKEEKDKEKPKAKPKAKGKEKEKEKSKKKEKKDAVLVFPSHYPMMPAKETEQCMTECLHLLALRPKGSRLPLPPGIVHAALLLLGQVCRSHKVASKCLKKGGCELILSLPQSCGFKGKTVLIKNIFKEILEDSSTLQSAMQCTIQEAVGKKLGKKLRGERSGGKGNGVMVVSLKNLVNHCSPLICR